MTTASQMLTPPIIAVGFLCQRSVFGFATRPTRRANTRTTGVSASASTSETACGIKLKPLNENIGNGELDELRSYSIGPAKASGTFVADETRSQRERPLCGCRV